MKRTIFLCVGLAIAGTAVYLVTHPEVLVSEADKRGYLLNQLTVDYAPGSNDYKHMADVVGRFSSDELAAVYVFIHDYVSQKRDVPQGSDLYVKISAISTKYKIFT